MDATDLDSGVGGHFDSLEQRVVDGVPREGEGAVDYAALDLNSEVQLHHVLLAQRGLRTHTHAHTHTRTHTRIHIHTQIR